MYVLMFLPNSLAHMCSRITSVFISLSQGGQTGGYPKTEEMLLEKFTINIKMKSNCDQMFMFLSFVKLWCLSQIVFVCNSLEGLQLAFNSGEPITVQFSFKKKRIQTCSTFFNYLPVRQATGFSPGFLLFLKGPVRHSVL